MDLEGHASATLNYFVSEYLERVSMTHLAASLALRKSFKLRNNLKIDKIYNYIKNFLCNIIIV